MIYGMHFAACFRKRTKVQYIYIYNLNFGQKEFYTPNSNMSCPCDQTVHIR